MKMIMSALLAGLMSMGVAFGQDSSSQTTAKQDMKDVGKETKQAAKDTGHATKKTTKKVVNKGATKTEEGAAKVKDKTAQQ
jgi:hypothetical protein